ncbi:hypothetical protein DXT87_09650 [Arthrobacter sp. AET 35A]|uniref:hypothetical protein n=1 Tax=Arthrobacter sp. 147(2020) TaxID=2735318 RepID=UPI0014910153|nr:hypothetical protein [Arthrobacter sp. 147(2020)]MBE0010055.1 hypothetical protein [Arthrobacter sp. AET 35A]
MFALPVVDVAQPFQRRVGPHPGIVGVDATLVAGDDGVDAVGHAVELPQRGQVIFQRVSRLQPSATCFSMGMPSPRDVHPPVERR